jgi:nucleotide-binding universal stress UspA family protein
LRRGSRVGATGGETAAIVAVSLNKDFMNTSRWAAADRRQPPHFERILCAFDVEQPSPAALELARLLAERTGSALESFYADNGSPARAILERASSLRADLIVLGARSRSDLGWQFRDDVVRDVSALAECATLTVHERDTPAALEHILVPVDFGPATRPVVERAAALALGFDASLQLLHVVSHQSVDESVKLAALERGLASRGIKVSADVIVASGAAHGIESHNQRGEFDLVVMGVSGSPHYAPRLTRGVIATLRNRLSVPLLSVRELTVDPTRPYARSALSELRIEGAPSVELSA